jgi:RNA polymerase sigma-70 factor (ECF subfamily)
VVQTDTDEVARPQGSEGCAPGRPVELGDLRDRMDRAVRKVAPAWMRDQIDDLVQVAMMKIMRSGKVEGDAELNNGFVYRVAHSVIVDEIRRRKRRNETDMDPSLPDPVEPHVRSDPEAMAGGQEIGAVIVECLGHLAVDRRRAVTLYLQGHSVPETAKLLDLQPKKAENLVYRGLAELRDLLRARGVEP